MEGRWTITICVGCGEQIVGIYGHVGQCDPADETEVPVVPCDDAAVELAALALCREDGGDGVGCACMDIHRRDAEAALRAAGASS